ncbi:MAG: hypothetical protein WBS24_03515 [Terriglobales bacterium]
MKFSRYLLAACAGVSMFCSILNAQQTAAAGTNAPPQAKSDVTGKGTAGFLPMWNSASGLIDSMIFQKGSQIGIGTTTPSEALDLGTNNNMVLRVDPGSDTTEAIGGYSLVGRGADGVPNTWWTLTAAVGGGFGVPANSYSIWQYPPNAKPGCCLNRFTILPAEASTDTGGTVTIDQDGDIAQPWAAGGTVKAMLSVNALTPPYKILGCFNSALTGAAATTPPCGINFTEADNRGGHWNFDFGSNVNVENRFFSATVANDDPQCISAFAISPSTVEVVTPDSCGSGVGGAYFYLIVY